MANKYVDVLKRGEVYPECKFGEYKSYIPEVIFSISNFNATMIVVVYSKLC